jgi:cullin 3
MLIELGIDGERVYETEFEELFLSASKSFYREEYLAYSSQFSCHEYIKKVEIRFLEEAKRVNRYLSKTTEPKLRAILNTELVSDHAESLVEMEYSGCRNMMKENNLENLKGIVTFSKINKYSFPFI